LLLSRWLFFRGSSSHFGDLLDDVCRGFGLCHLDSAAVLAWLVIDRGTRLD
jgi:hypothetical protein